MLLLDWISVLIILSGMLLSILYKKLTVFASLTGGVFAFCIYFGAGLAGLLMMAAFFIIGVFVTSWKWELKKEKGIAEDLKGKRTAAQVFANAGMAAIIGLVTYIFPEIELNAALMIAACFASATADTTSSELGNIYGKNFYHILSFKKGKRGANGIISAEGTLLGVAGSCIIACIYGLFFEININIIWIVLAGTIGNIADSILGATLEEKGYLSNNAVNFLNTFIAAIAVSLLTIA